MAALGGTPVPAGNRTCAGASTSYAQPTVAAQQRRHGARAVQQRAAPQQRRHAFAAGPAAARRQGAARLTVSAGLFGGGEIVEVKDLKGIRVLKNEDDTPRVEYLVEWKDGSADTWCACCGGGVVPVLSCSVCSRWHVGGRAVGSQQRLIACRRLSHSFCWLQGDCDQPG